MMPRLILDPDLVKADLMSRSYMLDAHEYHYHGRYNLNID